MITDFTKLHLPQQYPSLAMDIGDYTYGRPIILCNPDDRNRTLKIGRYCSIAENVHIFVGSFGRHAIEFPTTYPIGMLFKPHQGRLHRAHRGSLDVNIGHDVWIGRDALIMAGTTIGTGAVIAARAIVTKDVPPYAIVGGSPAHIIRYRFNEDTISAMLGSRWWDFEPTQLEQIAAAFYEEDMSKFVDAVRALGPPQPSVNDC